MNRPTRLTVVGIILIVMGVLAVINLGLVLSIPDVQAMAKAQPVPLPVQLALSTASALVMVASGVAVLNRRDWGRWLYVVWSAGNLLIGLLTSPMKLMLVPGALIVVVISAFLFSPKATAWLKTTGTGVADA